MREFVAVDVEPGGAGTRRATSHLTLLFLGEVPSAQNPTIVARLALAAGAVEPFRLRLEGVGAFPAADRPRVVWVGVTSGAVQVTELARQVRAALAPEFGRGEGEFVPHLTLFRVRGPADREAATDLLSGRRPPPPPREVEVRELLLKESVLGRDGASHRILATLPLGRTVP